ncbi:MAG: DEAD/DEAH box helicase [Streptosporangiaceae bacterium]|jgi:superfamily II DNA/RNA helicase
MEAEALTTHNWTMPSVPEDEHAAPDTLITETLAPEAPPSGPFRSEALPSEALPSEALPSDVTRSEKTFRDFGVAEPFCAALEAAGITHAFPIQALTLPIALDGHDLIGQARTGTGKTLAFGIPILQRLELAPDGKPSAPRALVVVPTRELAIQVAEDLRTAASHSGISVVTLYGGRAYEPQIEALQSVDVVVGTPGRLLDLVRQGHLDLSQTRSLVLDEADKMLDLGFLPDVEKILRLTPQHRQTMLFSATMPGEIVTLARRHLSRPVHVRAEQHDEPVLVPSTEQHVFRAHQMDKVEVLARVLQSAGRGLTIVFCRTKRACDQIAGALTTRGFAAAAVHGDLGQGQRERAMRAFRTGKVDVLVATDVAARGLDVDDVTHVVNYECPEDDKAYLHRTGRTGRAGRIGVAVTFVDWADMHRWKMINEALVLGRPEPVETYSTSAHLYEALNIPRDATGTLPRARRARLGLEAETLEDIGETGRNRSHAARPASGPGSRDRGRERGAGSGSRQRGGRSDSERTEPSRSRDTAQSRQRARRRTRAGAPVGAGQEPGRGAGQEPGGGGPDAGRGGRESSRGSRGSSRGSRGSSRGSRGEQARAAEPTAAVAADASALRGQPTGRRRPRSEAKPAHDIGPASGTAAESA